jgi:hypothetical protein
MRRMWRHCVYLAFVAVIGASTGCNCLWTGVCDCEPHGCGNIPKFQCAGCNGASNGTTATPTIATPTTTTNVLPDGVKTMPRVGDK